MNLDFWIIIGSTWQQLICFIAKDDTFCYLKNLLNKVLLLLLLNLEQNYADLHFLDMSEVMVVEEPFSSQCKVSYRIMSVRLIKSLDNSFCYLEHNSTIMFEEYRVYYWQSIIYSRCFYARKKFQYHDDWYCQFYFCFSLCCY